jgi:hypothetical protein
MIPYEECSDLEKKYLNGYMKTYENLVRHRDYKKDEHGAIALRRYLLEPMAFEDEIWIRSTATLYRKLTLPEGKEFYSFDRNLNLLSMLLRRNEVKMSPLEIEKRDFIFKLIKQHKKNAWVYVPYLIHKSENANFSSQEIVDIIHNEYIFHTESINDPVFETHFESFGDVYLELAYFYIIVERMKVLERLYLYLELYKKGELLEKVELPK